jgi:hypothetical protein
VGVQEVRWDKGGTERAEDYTFFYGAGNEEHRLGTGFCAVTAVCLRPRFPLLCFPFPVAHVVCVFPGFLPSPAAAFLGPQQTSSWSFASLLSARMQFSLDSKLWGGGRFYFGLESSGCFDRGPALSFCSIGHYYGVVWSEGLRTYSLILVFAFCCVCVSHGEFLQYYYVYRSLSSFPSVLVDGASVLTL